MAKEKYFVYQVDTTALARRSSPEHLVAFRLSNGKLELTIDTAGCDGRPSFREVGKKEYTRLKGRIL